MNSPLFLHITDAHVTGVGTELRRDDLKVKVAGIEHTTREASLELLFSRLAEHLQSQNRTLDGVIFTGDAADRGKLSGHEALLTFILDHLGPVGVTPAQIVATPGNHDVPRGTPPGSAERYEAFVAAWRKAGCVTPWLDGIDTPTVTNPGAHRLVDAEHRWALFPINSANWSHVQSDLPPELEAVWSDIPSLVAKGDPKLAETLKAQLNDIIRHDMARVSEEQLEALRQVVASTPQPTNGNQLRIAAIHHHLRSPSLREEVKAFADFTNLELLRRALRDRDIRVVLHGHKHVHAAQTELVYNAAGKDPSRLLVLSGATFDAHQEADAVRLLELNGLPWTPAIHLSRLALLRKGTEARYDDGEDFPLWEHDGTGSGSIVVHGSDLDTVYHRVRSAADGGAKGNTLVVDLDLPADAKASMPSDYPFPNALDQDSGPLWFNELAEWWQARHSRLEQRVPYHHGSRLYRYGGVFDQVARVAELLRRKPSSRAVAILIDPMRDFTPSGSDDEDFASFCLVQFRKRETGSASFVDVIGYYRAQEFARWWPINIAELRGLQLEVIRDTNAKPGRITTMTAEARAFGRSPTEVSVPVIDRWLDQHPGRLFLLATYLSGRQGESEEPNRADVVRSWVQSLEDFEQATQDYNPDGVPFAIEGLEALAIYITALGPKGDLASFLRALTGLINANRAYAATRRLRSDFEKWGARDHLANLKRLSLSLLGKYETSIPPIAGNAN